MVLPVVLVASASEPVEDVDDKTHLLCLQTPVEIVNEFCRVI